MADDFTAKFKVDISDLKKNLTEANAQIKKANATFKAETAGMDKWSKDADGLSAKMDQLGTVLKAQKKILEAYEEEMKRNKEAYAENGKRADELRAKLQELADKGVDKSSEEYKKYRDALVATEKEQAKNAKAVDDLELKILDQTAAVKDTEKQMRHYGEALDDLGKDQQEAADSAEDLGKAAQNGAQAAQQSAGGFTVMKGALADLVASGIKAAIDGLKDLAKGIYDSWASFDEGADNITKLTGATGDAAKSLQESYTNVSKSVVGEFADIGNAIGEVNTRFGTTGKDLEDLSTQFIKFAEINGTDVVTAVDGAQSAMAAWGLSAEDASGYLDLITKASQDTGTSVDAINASLLKNATAFQEMGLSVSDSAMILANFEKNGIDTEQAMGGLRKALQNAVKEGKPLDQAFAEMEASIKGAATETEAMQVATELFGAKAGPALASAVRDGRISFEELGTTMEDFAGTVGTTYDATLDGPDKIKLALQGLKVEVAETFGEFLEKYGPQLEAAVEGFTTYILPVLVGALQAVFTIIETIIQVIKTWGQIFKDIGNQIRQTIEAIKGFFQNLGEKIRQIFESVKTTIRGAIDSIKTWFSDLWNKIATGAATAWSNLTSTFSKIGEFFGGVWKSISEKFSALGTKIGDAISGAVKAGINGVIRQVEGALNGAISLINGAINLINKIPGVSVRSIAKLSLPRLEQGGILRRGQVGLLEGSGDEAVVPLHQNKKWIRNVAASMVEELAGQNSIINNSTSRSTNTSFTQIINAPKAPSRIELYRQTRNLLALKTGGIA